jgi:flagellar biosynthesis protein FlhB
VARDAGERTLPPTARRRAEARRRGQVALSRDLGQVAALAATLAVLAALAPAAFARLTRYLAASLSGAAAGGGVGQAAQAGLHMATSLLAAPLALAFVVTLVVGLAQTGGLVTFHPVRFDLGRLSPVAALRSVLDRRAAFEIGKGLVGMTAIAAVAWLTVRPLLPRILELPGLPSRSTIEALAAASQRLGLRIVLTAAVLALIDVVVAHAHHRRSLLMTRDEARRERAETEGDDAHRARRRRAHRALGEQASTGDVRRADVVIVARAAAPGDDRREEVAVALVYRRGGEAAPVVLLKGRDLVAARLLAAARDAGVAVVDLERATGAIAFSHPALVQDLAAVPDGGEIPESCYGGVAEVLKSVYGRNATAAS